MVQVTWAPAPDGCWERRGAKVVVRVIAFADRTAAWWVYMEPGHRAADLVEAVRQADLHFERAER